MNYTAVWPEATKMVKYGFKTQNIMSKRYDNPSKLKLENCFTHGNTLSPLVAGAWTERKKMYHGGSFLKLADDNMDIQNPEAQNRELSGF